MDNIICIVGPTSSGKSELAVRLAKKYNGEVVSVDSRQIYKGMDIGTGKVTGKWRPFPHGTKNHGRQKMSYFIYKTIPHHLIDFVDPKRQYSVAQFQKQAQKTIKNIIKRGKLPILCGGTGHWMDAVVYNQHLPEVKPNKKLRAELEKKSAEILFKRLKKLDPVRAKTIDPHNKRRLIRALEIIISTGKPVPNLSTVHRPLFTILWIGITWPQDVLYKKIEKRLKQRLKEGMLHETKKLHKQGLSWRRLETFGLEYKFTSLNLQKKLSYDEMYSQLLFAIKHYSKRQLTWWKRNKNIRWIQSSKEAAVLTKHFLSS